MDTRSRETQRIVDNFFAQNPSLASQKKLVVAALPWVSGGTEHLSTEGALEKAKALVVSSRRGEGMTGDWYGVFSQESVLQNGKMVSFNRFFRVGLDQKGNAVLGSGETSAGEQLRISGKEIDGNFQGIVDNVTHGITAQLLGTVTDEQTVLNFDGLGMQEKVKGIAALYRYKQ